MLEVIRRSEILHYLYKCVDVFLIIPQNAVMLEIKTTLQAVPDHVATGAEFRKRRLALRLKQQDVAKEMGIHPSLLTALEAGKRNWTEARLRVGEAALLRMAPLPESAVAA